MQGQTMTNTEYLLRTVRESERMTGWKDTFAKMREDFTKEFLAKEAEARMESFDTEDRFNK